MIHKAIILAAGRSLRISKFTRNKPKCLIKIPFQKLSIIERQIGILKKNKIKDILVVTGFKSKLVKNHLKRKVRYRHYKNYKFTNNLQTVISIEKEFNQDLICLFSDVIFDSSIIVNLIRNKNNIVVAVDKSSKLKDTMRVTTKAKKILDIGPHIKLNKSNGNFIGICKFKKEGALLFAKQFNFFKKNTKDYYTVILRKLAKKKNIHYMDVKNDYWTEIDNYQDYEKFLRKKISLK